MGFGGAGGGRRKRARSAGNGLARLRAQRLIFKTELKGGTRGLCSGFAYAGAALLGKSGDIAGAVLRPMDTIKREAGNGDSAEHGPSFHAHPNAQALEEAFGIYFKFYQTLIFRITPSGGNPLFTTPSERRGKAFAVRQLVVVKASTLASV